jgi:DNA-binding IclR family transcriptional regulator
MVELAAQTRTNIGLGVHENLSVLYLEYALGERNPNRRQRVGFRVPLIRTAMGRACIASMDIRERDRLYAQLSQHYPDEWADLHGQLDDAVAQVEAKGYCVADRTFQQNTISVAVPYLDNDGRTVMAFNSQGSASTQTPAILAKNGKRLLAMADQVRARMRASPATPSLG